MHLEADGAGAGLTFALAGSCLAEVGEVLAANPLGGEIGEFADAAAVVHEDLEVHLGFAAKFIDIAEELALVGPDGFAETVVVVEYRAESEGKNGGVFEAVGDYSCVIDA
jgi:hypothetical protein